MSLDRVAGAPISWGVCEVPGWGYQLSPERVLHEMAALGIKATELGPEGFLPADARAAAAVLEASGISAVGGFNPVLLHDPSHDPVGGLKATLDLYEALPAQVVVLAAVTGLDGYDTRPVLDDDGWRLLLDNLERAAGLVRDRGLVAALHPHVGTMVERPDEVARVLDGSSVPLCLDTGHLLIGGSDPVELVRRAPERVAHVHLKDVDATLAAEVTAGSLTYTEAVAQGMYRALGQGDVDIATIVRTLEAHGYQGWYVLEQDTVLGTEPADEGPVAAVRASYSYVAGLL